MAMRIGCSNLVYAKMTTEETASSAPTYATPVAAPGVMHININPNVNSVTAFYDDGPGDVATTLGNIEVEIEKNLLTAQQKADLLGHVLDANKGLVYADSDTPPWVAIGFKTLKSNGTYRYVWLFKGRFSEPEDNSETKGDSVNFQSETIKGNFVKLDYEVTVAAGVTKRPWKYEIDEETTDVNAPTISGWFSAVKLPSNTAGT
jgi:phi13 family phage major tail protein